MTAFYNEIDPYAAQWLRNLIAAGEIAPGVVDERDIRDIRPDELAGYTQCHFFAGIGGWSLALRLAGWPDDRPVWTGSCPCQPFSAAGKGEGFADERHLWPDWFHLISQCRPPSVLGEQVASKATEPWLDLVRADLEALGYAFGAVAVPAAGVGAPHIRGRTWWVAQANFGRSADSRTDCGNRRRISERLADAAGGRLAECGDAAFARRGGHADCGSDASGVVAYPGSSGLQEQRGRWNDSTARHGDSAAAACGDDRLEPAGPLHGFWRDADWLFCRDGKWRPVEPGTFPLAHGIPARVGRLRAYGNAINAEAGAEFIRAVM